MSAFGLIGKYETIAIAITHGESAIRVIIPSIKAYPSRTINDLIIFLKSILIDLPLPISRGVPLWKNIA
jgi:hypothetical protein